MSSVFDRYMTLFEAYHRLGAHLFGHEWDELSFDNLRLSHPPTTNDALREPLEAELRSLCEEREELSQARRSLRTRGAFEDALEHWSRLEREIAKAEADLGAIPPDNPDYASDWADQERHEEVFRCIWAAITGGEVGLCTFRGSLIEPRQIEEGRVLIHFRESIGLILDQQSPWRVQTLFVERIRFREWLKRAAPEPTNEAKSSEKQCAEWIRERARANPTPVPRKPDVWEEAEKRFPGLSKRAFDRAWAQEADERWKDPGRKSSGN